MCVVNKQFELVEFVFDSVNVDLQYDEISLTFTAGSVSVCCVCSHVDVVVTVIVMCILLFVLCVCMLGECEGERLTEMRVWGWMRCGCGEYRACGSYTLFRYFV